MNELFTDLEPSNPSRLTAARKAVEKAEAECERLKATSPEYDQCPAPLKWEINEARMKLNDARHELQESEVEAFKAGKLEIKSHPSEQGD
jgi:multidrug resistance efflux pump